MCAATCLTLLLVLRHWALGDCDTGAISIAEFIQAMHNSGFQLKPEEAMTIAEMFTRNKRGEVPRENFVITVKKLLKMPTGEHTAPAVPLHRGHGEHGI